MEEEVQLVRKAKSQGQKRLKDKMKGALAFCPKISKSNGNFNSIADYFPSMAVLR
jgi:hypothetical protein